MYDTIIIGAGPTGLTAAIYAARRAMKTLIISKNLGGQVIWASEIKNLPWIGSIGGVELIQKISQQVKDLGVEIINEEVKKIGQAGDGSFLIESRKGSYQAKTLIIAMGLAPKKLHLPKEDELTGKGISYCANCDGPLFKGKNVAVVGGGNAALDAAEVMSKIAVKVFLIYRRGQFKGFESLAEQVKSRKNIDIMLNSEICEILGENKLKKLAIKNLLDKTIKKIEVQGLFVEIGHEPKTDLLADFVERDTLGQIIVDLSGKTSRDGVFAAGDVTQNEFKQIVIGCGQGAVAALSVYKYLQTKK